MERHTMNLRDYLGVKSASKWIEEISDPHKGLRVKGSGLKKIENPVGLTWEIEDFKATPELNSVIESYGLYWDKFMTKEVGGMGAVASYKDPSQKVFDEKYKKQMESLAKKVGEDMLKAGRKFSKDTGIEFVNMDYTYVTFADQRNIDVTLSQISKYDKPPKEIVRATATIAHLSVQFIFDEMRVSGRREVRGKVQYDWNAWEQVVKTVEDARFACTGKTPNLSRALFRAEYALKKMNTMEIMAEQKDKELAFDIMGNNTLESAMSVADDLQNVYESLLDDYNIDMKDFSKEHQAQVNESSNAESNKSSLVSLLTELHNELDSFKNQMIETREADDDDNADPMEIWNNFSKSFYTPRRFRSHSPKTKGIRFYLGL